LQQSENFLSDPQEHFFSSAGLLVEVVLAFDPNPASNFNDFRDAILQIEYASLGGILKERIMCSVIPM
jgi:hypothetical protein